jgi:dCMP deaminase
MDIRLSWDEYFLQFLPAIANRATCDRGKAACIIVKDNYILSTGYAGSVSGQPHCDEVGHLMIKQLNQDGSVTSHCCKTAHSEQNAIAQAAKRGISVDGATIYITMEPCFSCAKLLIQSGIKRIVCLKQYHNAQLTRELCESAGIELIVIEKEVEKY